MRVRTHVSARRGRFATKECGWRSRLFAVRGSRDLCCWVCGLAVCWVVGWLFFHMEPLTLRCRCSFGSQRSCPARSSRMFTFRCGGRKRGTQVRGRPVFLPPLGNATSSAPDAASAGMHAAPTTMPVAQAAPAVASPSLLPTQTMTTRALAPPASDSLRRGHLQVHNLLRLRTFVCRRPVSLLPGIQSPPASDADSSLLGFRPVDCPLRLPADDADACLRQGLV